MKKKIWLIVMVMFFFGHSPLSAQTDQTGCRDHPLLSRMDNFYLKRCKEEKFDEVPFRNEKGEKITVAGRVWRLSYAIKKGFTPPSGLMVLRNYEDAITGLGGTKVYQEGKYEIWLKLDKDGKTYWVYVDSWSGGGKGETYELQIVEKEAMPQEVVANAEALLKDIKAAGHVAVYGIYFDFDKADIKPESEPAIKEIARLLQENKELKIHLVGHTDNIGTIQYNLKLSKARAEAVVRELTQKYHIAPERLSPSGVGPLAPVATNRTDAGRAKNRRVELVEQ